jgi:predicted GH43/DUF377 family glycosyl hydrolase
MRRLVALVALGLAGCGRYADFSLPDPGPAEAGAYRWQARPAPVIPNQAVDTLNPSVFPWQGRLANLFSVFDGSTWRTAVAQSADGFTWGPARTVLSPDAATWEKGYIAANGATVVFHGELLHYYQAGAAAQIGLARGTALDHWKKEPRPVLAYGPRGAWDERVTADPDVFEAGGRLYLYYLGEDRARRQRLGLATSDDGLKWTKLRSSPVLELGAGGAFDENGLGEPAVWRAHGAWWMLYTGRARDEVRRLGLVRSRDGLHWKPTGLIIEGGEAWNSKVVCDATVIAEPERVRVWFGGGDAAQPAEHLHGQIGYGELLWQPR